MLVLTRIIGRSIVITYRNKNKIEKVTVAPLGLHGKKIKIGIEAPKRIPVYRQEIYKNILAKGEKL